MYMDSYDRKFMRDFLNSPIPKKSKLPRPTYGNKASKRAMFKRKKTGRIT